jgi:hypothetical protein
MRRDRTLSWFHRLDLGQQAALLADPHGYLREGVAAAIRPHTEPARHDETLQYPRRWLLRSAEANLLEDERHRLDKWWQDLTPEVRSALIECRAEAVPREHRKAVLESAPGGMRPGTDLDIGFEMTDMAAAYLEMVAAKSA